MTTRGPRQLPLTVNGADLVADLTGVLWWPARRTLVVSDLHLEKGSGFAAKGRLLPPYDTAATLDRLGAAIGRLAPARVICLGDSFHDRGAPARLSSGDGARLAALIGGREWIWIAGNHDPSPPADWGGRVAAELVDGPLVFRHQAQDGVPAAGEISGHYHPKATVRVRTHRITAPCFASDGRRLVLPAFGAFTGGLNVTDPAIAGLLGRRFVVMLRGRERLYTFPRERLAPDPDGLWRVPAAGRV